MTESFFLVLVAAFLMYVLFMIRKEFLDGGGWASLESKYATNKEPIEFAAEKLKISSIGLEGGSHAKYSETSSHPSRAFAYAQLVNICQRKKCFDPVGRYRRV